MPSLIWRPKQRKQSYSHYWEREKPNSNGSNPKNLWSSWFMISKLEGFHVMSVNTTMRWVEEGKTDFRKRETEMKSPTASLASLVAQLVKNLPPVWETWFDLWVGKIPWRREWQPTSVFWPGEFHGLYIVHGSQRVGHDWVTFTNASLTLQPEGADTLTHQG